MASHQLVATTLVVVASLSYLPILTSAMISNDVCAATYSSTGALCSCTTVGTYDCRQRSIKEVPTGFSNVSATKLILSNNKLVELRWGYFNHLRKLDKLYLQVNYIAYIEPGTFDGLMKLTELILTDNRLASIEAGVFHHLPGLTTLDLSQNAIHTIHRHAFFTLPSLENLNLDGNDMRCGCDARLLKKFFDSAFSCVCQQLTIPGATCTNLQDRNLLDIPTRDFPQCTDGQTLFEPSTQCYRCDYVAGLRECAASGQVIECNPDYVCYTTIKYSGDHMDVSGGCMNYANCMPIEWRNYYDCQESTNIHCHFCRQPRLSNAHDILNSTYEFDLLAVITLNGDLTAQLQDTASAVYKTYMTNGHSELANYLYNAKGAFLATIISLRGPQLQVEVHIHCASMWFVSTQQVEEAIKNKLMGRGFYANTIVDVNLTPIRAAYCNADTQYDRTYGEFHWPVTNADSAATVDCPYQLSTNSVIKASRKCELLNNGTAQWATPSIQYCPFAQPTARELSDMAKISINDGNVERVAANLSSLSNQWQTFDSVHVTMTADIIDNILLTSLSTTSGDVIGNTMDTFNNLLKIEQGIITRSQDESDTSERLIAAVDKLLSGMDVTTGDYRGVKDNLAGVVSKTDSNTFQGMTMSYTDSADSLTHSQMKSVPGEGTLTREQSGIVLPQNMLMTLSRAQKSRVSKMTLSVYKDAKLFAAISKPTTVTPPSGTVISDEDEDRTAIRKINSNVISASVPGVTIQNLDTPVKITFHHKQSGENATCVYWSTVGGEWRTDGCVRNETSDGMTTCHCDHLTNFALLMDVYGSGDGLDDANRLALAIISYVGCALSLIGITLTLISYIKFRKLRRNNLSKILMNLCVAIGCIDVVFLLGMQAYTSESLPACKAVAVILHYLLLSAMCWMAVEAFYMYLALVKILDTYIARFQLKSALFGWGIPLVIVTVTLVVNLTDNYGLQAAGMCWLGRVPFYAAFLGPVCLILILNAIAYSLVLKQLMKRGSKQLTKRDTSVKLRGALGLLVLLGLTWVFAFFAIGDFGIVFHYLFALLNTMQGFFIFIFYCCMKKEVRQCWRKSLPCLKSPYEKGVKNTDTKDSSATDSGTRTTQSSNMSSHSQMKGGKKYEVDTSSTSAFRGQWQYRQEDKQRQSSTFA